ncbi:MAG: hypothetical protein ACN2B6_12180 [Rickettsiales bacterium]
MRWILLIFITLFITGCVKQSFVAQNENYVIKNETINFYNYTKKRNFDGCSANAYTIEDEELFLEYVKLRANCTWNGLGSSFFRNLLNQEFDLNVLQSEKQNGYTIVKYQSGAKEFYFISTYVGGGNYFIIDEYPITGRRQTPPRLHRDPLCLALIRRQLSSGLDERN